MSATKASLLVLLFLFCALPASSDSIRGGTARGANLPGALLPAPPLSGACTNGSSCYCDKARGTGTLGISDPSYNAAIVYCEDFDDDEFRITSGSANWVAADQAGNRGGDSLWARRYGNGAFGSYWENNEPNASPTYGVACAFAGGCTGMKEWDEDDRWQANALEPWIDIIDEASDFTAEDAAAGTPTIDGTGGQSFFGNAMLAYRNGPGRPATDRGAGGIIHSRGASIGPINQLGYTAMWGYDAKVLDYSILSQAWKHDEVVGVRGGAANGLLGFRSTGNADPLPPLSSDRFPFHNLIFTEGYSCATMIASANFHGLSRAFCDGADNFQHETTSFSFAASWDLTKQHCVSWYWDFRTINSVTLKAWFDGTLVIHVTGLNMTGSMYDGLGGTNGVGSVAFNNYSNRSNLSDPQNLTARPGVNRRYADNVTIVNSTPQLCSKLGFPTSYNQAGL